MIIVVHPIMTVLSHYHVKCTRSTWVTLFVKWMDGHIINVNIGQLCLRCWFQLSTLGWCHKLRVYQKLFSCIKHVIPFAFIICIIIQLILVSMFVSTLTIWWNTILWLLSLSCHRKSIWCNFLVTNINYRKLLFCKMKDLCQNMIICSISSYFSRIPCQRTHMKTRN